MSQRDGTVGKLASDMLMPHRDNWLPATGLTHPNGYTVPLLHSWHLKVKATA